MCEIVPVKSIGEEINGVCGRKTVRGRTFTGFNVWGALIETKRRTYSELAAN